MPAYDERIFMHNQETMTFLACKPGISMPGLHALFFVDYSRYMASF